MGTQQVRPRAPRLSPDERRAALLEAATVLFIAKGNEFTTADLASAAGVAEGTIFRYFPDKAALMQAAKDAALDLDSLTPMLSAAAELPTLAQRLVAAAHALQPRIEQMARVVEQMDHHGPPDDDLIQELLTAIAPLFAGLSSSAAPDQLAMLFLGSMLANAVLAGKGGVEPLTVDRLADLFLHGIEPL